MLKYVCCVLLACSSLAWGQDTDSALKAARELAGAVKSGDIMWMLDKMYPQARATAAKNLKGGDAELQGTFRRKSDEFKKSGVVFESYTVQQPTMQFPVKNNTELIVIVPYSFVMAVKSPSGELRRSRKTSFLYAIAKRAEKDKWYFLDGSSYSVNDMRYMFYDLPMNLKDMLPKISEAQL